MCRLRPRPGLNGFLSFLLSRSRSLPGIFPTTARESGEQEEHDALLPAAARNPDNREKLRRF